jgi:hypothetical protein
LEVEYGGNNEFNFDAEEMYPVHVEEDKVPKG